MMRPSVHRNATGHGNTGLPKSFIHQRNETIRQKFRIIPQKYASEKTVKTVLSEAIFLCTGQCPRNKAISTKGQHVAFTTVKIIIFHRLKA